MENFLTDKKNYLNNFAFYESKKIYIGSNVKKNIFKTVLFL